MICAGHSTRGREAQSAKLGERFAGKCDEDVVYLGKVTRNDIEDELLRYGRWHEGNIS